MPSAKPPASAPARPLGRRSPRAARAPEIWRRLAARYPDAHCALDYRSPYELVAATILSAQCTDVRVNMVTPLLFESYPTPASLAAADPADVEEIIRSTGFFRAKARSLVGMAQAVERDHAGTVPAEMDALTALPGVGRKTANVVLGNAFGIDAGVVVDTHVTRVSGRLALTRHTDPVKIERDLMPLFPREQWTLLSHRFIAHGRETCVARKPKCGECVVAELCPAALTRE